MLHGWCLSGGLIDNENKFYHVRHKKTTHTILDNIKKNIYKSDINLACIYVYGA